MTATMLDDNTALILVDLQQGLLAAPLAPVPGAELVASATRLADAFRAARRPVVLVRVAFPDMDSAPPMPRVDQPMPMGVPLPGAADFPDQLTRAPSDIQLTKRSWSAFHRTGLDEQLRGIGVTGLVIAGIATSVGVESTARSAADHGYNVTVAVDAVSDIDPEVHQNSVTKILPRIAELDTAEAITALLK